jgi:hypothetical protein
VDGVAGDRRREIRTGEHGKFGRGAAVLAHPAARPMRHRRVEDEQPFHRSELRDVGAGLGSTRVQRRCERDDRGDQLGMPVGEVERDQASGRVRTDHGRPIGSGRLAQAGGDGVGVVRGSVAVRGLRRGAEAQEIGDDQTAEVGELVERGTPVPVRRCEPVQQHDWHPLLSRRASRERAVPHIVGGWLPVNLAPAPRDSDIRGGGGRGGSSEDDGDGSTHDLSIAAREELLAADPMTVRSLVHGCAPGQLDIGGRSILRR